MESITRFGNLKQLFGRGESELLNLLARLSVLYEDLRIEVDSLAQFRDLDSASVNRYKVLYFVRRTTATLDEFQGCLTQMLSSDEYKAKEKWMTKVDRDTLKSSNRHLQARSSRIKRWRNDMGGHFQAATAINACRNLHESVASSLSWDPGDDSIYALRLNYAEELICSAVGFRLEGEDMVEALSGDLKEVMSCYGHAQVVTYAAIYAFIWDRFGR